MITTIQLNNNVKKLLDGLKESGKETYEEVILSMMKQLEEKRRNEKEMLMTGYQEMADESLKISREFESIEDLKEWEW